MACFLVPMAAAVAGTVVRKKFSEKLHFNWLLSMLWGGVIMLAVEHISHREIVPYPPFLTAGLNEVLTDMLKIGVPMLLAIVLVWGVMVIVSNLVSRKAEYTFGPRIN